MSIMAASLKIESLASDPRERKKLYQLVRPVYFKQYKNSDGDKAFGHAHAITEDVAMYSRSCKDQNWAGRCVFLAAVHAFRMRALDDVRGLFPESEQISLIQSFNRFNILRNQDESAPELKDMDIYKALASPYVSASGLILLHPEIFVRVVDMSQPQIFYGKKARELHGILSIGTIEEINSNIAHSMLDVWRPAAIQLSLFDCYDRQSDLAAQALYEKLFDKITRIYRELEKETVQVGERFSQHLKDLIALSKKKGLPLVMQTDRKTGSKVDHTVRFKTRGSTVIKLVRKENVDPYIERLDLDFVLKVIHDKVASTLVSERTCDAESLFQLIRSRDIDIIIEAEHIFYGRAGHRGSLPGYRETGHIDYHAPSLGAEKIQRVELHVKSYQGYVDYYYSPTSCRGARESPVVADAWGDYNFKIVQALGNTNRLYPSARKGP